MSPSPLCYTVRVLVESKRGPRRWCGTGRRHPAAELQVWAVLSLVPTGVHDPQAQLSFPGGPAEAESPEPPFEALQEERLSLTPGVRGGSV